MRNLKKILALVLALVMSLSLMATAGAADFPDKDQITDKYSTAIEVLSGLEVFQGYKEDGTFRPQGDITRAEVAAIIYRIATADVTGAQESIYSSWGLFSDVADGSWYAGYVNYCANAGYIKGRGNKVFDPNGKVTGYEALAMILRAIGYDKNNEFSGSNWQVRTASIAKQRHITDNITDTMLGQPATREVVAEILFQSILVPQVQFNTSTLSYSNRETSLGYDVLKLEEVTGIVVSNEYANLKDDEVLAEGKTGFEVEGTTRTLDYGTELTDIGESRFAYIQNAKVLSIADSGKNKVFDNTTTGGDGVDISTTAKFKKVSDIAQQDGTEFFTNFDFTGIYDSDYRIELKVTFENDRSESLFNGYAGVTIENLGYQKSGDIYPKTYREVFKAGDKIEENDLKAIQGIFGMADDINNDYGVEGSVWVGSTSSTNQDYDKTNVMSYKAFKDEYINDQEKGNWNTANDGEWVKIVDNNGDGKAEYAFKTLFTLDKVLGTYTEKGVEYNEFYALNITEDDGVDARYMNDVAVNDIVLHTTIDGQALIWKANIDTDSVKLVSHKDKTLTTTGDVTYNQSGINNVTRLEDDVTMVDDNVDYNFYLDAFGRIRAYEPVDGIKYALLTEMYYTSGQNDRFQINSDLTVEMFAGSSSVKEYNVSNASGSDFILRLDGVQHPTWRDLDPTGKGVYAATNSTGTNKWQNNILQPATDDLSRTRTQADIFPTATTNVARYVVEKNGDMRLTTAERSNSNTNGYSYDVKYVDLVNGSGFSAKQELFKIEDDYDYTNHVNNPANYSDTLRALSTTEFYIVAEDGVSYFTDYRNLPKIDAPINAAYAVARSSQRTVNNVEDKYWVADVIVIEAPDFQVAEDDLLLVLGLQSWWTNDTQSENSRMATFTNQDLLAISAKTGEVVRVIPNNRGWGDRYLGAGLYRVWGLEDVETGVVSADTIQYVDLRDGTSNVASTYKLRAGIVEAVNDHAEGSSRYITVWTKGEGNTSGLKTVYANAYNWGVLESKTNARNITTPQLRVSETGNKRVMPGDLVLWIEGSNTAKFIVDLTYDADVKRDENRQTPAWLTEMYTDVMYEQLFGVTSTNIKVKAVDPNGNVKSEAVMLFDEHGVPMHYTVDKDGIISFQIPSDGNTSRYMVTIGYNYGFQRGNGDVTYLNSENVVAQYAGKYDVRVGNGTIVVPVKDKTPDTIETAVYEYGEGEKLNANVTVALDDVVNELTVVSTGNNPIYALDKTITNVRAYIGDQWFTIVADDIRETTDHKSFTIDFSWYTEGDGKVTINGDVRIVYILGDAMTEFDITVPTDLALKQQATRNGRLANPQPVVKVTINGQSPVAKLSSDGMSATYTFKFLASAKLTVTISLNKAAELPAGQPNVAITWAGVEYIVTANAPVVLKNQDVSDVIIAADDLKDAEATDETPATPVELASVTVNGKALSISGEANNGTYSIGDDVYVVAGDVTVRAVAADSTQEVTIAPTSGSADVAALANERVTGTGSAVWLGNVAENGTVTLNITVSKGNSVKTYTLTLTNVKPE